MRFVCCSEDKDVLQLLDTVHLHKKCGQCMCTAGRAASCPLLGDGVNFIEEDDAWTGGSGFLEDVPYCSFGLTNIHAQEFGSFDCYKVQARLRCQGLCHESLGATWWSVKEDAFCALDVESLHPLRKLQQSESFPLLVMRVLPSKAAQRPLVVAS